MNTQARLNKEAMHMLKQTSRTFYIPITFLEKSLKPTVASAYLCMRAIDEIEDHPNLSNEVKAELLSDTAKLLALPFDEEAYHELLKPYEDVLPEVSWRLGDWLSFCPEEIRVEVARATAEMADGMAKWAERNWLVETKEDLDDYTYYVAGLVGVMLSHIWKWYDGTESDRERAIGFGRGLQAVNILRNQDEDFERGVSFLPEGWTRDDLFRYAEANLALGDAYIKDLSNRSMVRFCKIPLALAYGSIKAMRHGREKISRSEVEEIVSEIENETK